MAVAKFVGYVLFRISLRRGDPTSLLQGLAPGSGDAGCARVTSPAARCPTGNVSRARCIGARWLRGLRLQIREAEA
eukprot:CAMPEP_0204339954 /NCGR_PEP_ID=MMETSP0469-20131031/22196_1 /ASSEMBLY_ACC=CAM_ASM_000384 /TAXON_ID=2969 /ORGANISM="Oxyrrhis marina" /LENGTH=75 /DNA_ID=CAMNT_0051324373 /DNA_START=14 /DNA_END=238 /DNA_ORIENTATION=+